MGYPNDAVQAGNYYNGLGGNANQYTFVTGVCILPLAEDPPTDPTELAAYTPIVTLRLHAPYRVRNFTQMEDKTQNPPPIAAPGDTGKFVFVGGSVAISTGLNTSGVNYDWAVGCSYTYVENCVSRNQDGLILGTMPVATLTDKQNTSFGYAPPAIGALSDAGQSARVGYNMGALITVGSDGQLKSSWGYNQPSFYPGQLFYSDLANGGKPFSQGG